MDADAVTAGVMRRPRTLNSKGLVNEYRRPKSAHFHVREILARIAGEKTNAG